MADSITIQGVVHGDRIEIPAPPGFAEGQVVSVTLQSVATGPALPPGIVDSFGILTSAEGEDLDRFLQESRDSKLVQNWTRSFLPHSGGLF